CPHYGECGGCSIEHLDYAAQLQVKERIVADAFARIGGIALPRAPEAVASPQEFRYRNRVSFTLKRSPGGVVEAGFHSLHEPHRITPVDGRCLLPEQVLSDAWDELRW